MMVFCAHFVTRDQKQSKRFSPCSTNSSIFHWKASISMCLCVPTVTDKLDKAHLSSRPLFKKRESADQYRTPTGVHSTLWVVLSENHYATVISPTWEKSRPCPPEKSHTDDEMNFRSVPGLNVWAAISFFFSSRKAVLSQFRPVWWALLPGYRVRLSPRRAEKADRRFAVDSNVNSHSGSEELAHATVILLTGKWSCHSWSWCVEPRSRHLHVAAGLSFLHERLEERRHSLLHHLDKMGWGTRGP